MAAVQAKELTTQGVTAVRFSFYSDEEVRKLSVKRIITPVVFDNLKNPLPDGLYDPSMGPIDARGSCTTCGLNSTNCPGHFGHIELPLPVYNPLIFKTLYRLLRATCLYCYQFRIPRSDMALLIKKLTYLSDGNLTMAMKVNLGHGMTAADIEDCVGELKMPKRALQEAAEEKACAGAPPSAPTAHVLEALRDTISEFFGKVRPGKCPCCKAHNPAIKKQGNTKLFKVWTQKAQVDNANEGRVLINPLEDERSLESIKEEMSKELSKKASLKKGKKGAAAAKKGKKIKTEGDDGEANKEETEDEDEEDEQEDSGSDIEERMVPAGSGQRSDGKKPVLLAEDKVKFITPMEAEEIMKRVWGREHEVLSLIYAAEVGAPPLLDGKQLPTLHHMKVAASATPLLNTYKMFFLRVLPIAPNKFRPPAKMGEELFEHPQNTVLSKVLDLCLDLQSVNLAADPKDGSSQEACMQQQQLALSRYVNLWLQLQNKVCELIDTTTADKPGDLVGIRQILEKKEGMFRKNMMGKRVNFAARSVISPDPYIGCGEIGLPPYFAKRLSFPERVTPWNVERLREAVIRGPDNHPGAVSVENENGQLIHLAALTPQRREALAKQLLSGYSHGGGSGKGGKSVGVKAAAVPLGGKIVYRHLQDGDLMLTNRQPTLHKPGLMAHRARVLRGERTIRMHYANCATFNADFDGDEINLHLPQDHLGRAEGYGIVHADQQYIVPTDGKPIRGLIQDHVVSGVLLTKRDNFLTKAQYMQLVYIACTPWVSAVRKGGGAVHQVPNDPLDLEPPTLIKPKALWTGKQVISTVVRHFTKGLPPITFDSGSKVPADYWGRNSGEHELRFHKGYLVTGCIDKNQFGKFGLVHAIQELYGNNVAGSLLSSFSRLFTHFLQWNGFTCGIDDTLLVPEAEEKRLKVLNKAEFNAVKASADFVGVPVPADKAAAKTPSARRAAVAGEEAVCEALSERYRSNRNTGIAHDMKGSGTMHPLSSEVVSACLPSGQVKAFPKNCLSLMTISGAKGSLVNFSQISCLLGQQELEGRRVPRMSTGKTLPCFRAYDAGARSCGFVGDRFLSGLRPQEYYFHCMAGREGLVDTTVKTSRSGYLQRCMIKNLESLRVHYDGTVRDNCDGSVVQFLYGEDGLDVMNVSYLKQFSFLAKNADRVAQQLDLNHAESVSKVAHLTQAEAEVATASAERLKAQRNLLDPECSKNRRAKAVKHLASSIPSMAVYPPAVLGSVSEAFGDALNKYVMANPDGLLTKVGIKAEGGEGASEGKASKKKDGKKKEEEESSSQLLDAERFSMLTKLKYMTSLAVGGEAVGVIAGQSIGEPSTQMTLNTFHMAGRGEANVTLGIPRLREILMSATSKIKTPVMTLPLHKGLGATEANVLANRLRKLRLAECLSEIVVEEAPVAAVADPSLGGYARVYSVVMQFFKPSQYPTEAKLTFDELAMSFRESFCPSLFLEVARVTKKSAKGRPSIGKVSAENLAAAAAHDGDDGGDYDDLAATAAGPSGGQDIDEEEGASKRTGRGKQNDDGEEDEDDEDAREGKLLFRGGRTEAASYDAGDEDDQRIAKVAARIAASKSLAGLDDDEDEDDSEGSDQEQGAPEAKGKGKAKAVAKATKKKPAAKTESARSTPSCPGVVDSKNCRCYVSVTLPLDCPKLLMLELVERVAANTMVRNTPMIEKVYVVEAKGSAEVASVQTDGINFVGAWAHSDLLDVNSIITNDVSGVLHTYGVEAARATIMREAQSVFGAYGIGVDPRHLCLIADFMTHQGGYRACNRIGIESAVSPFLKMSFETAAHFLTDATLKGSVDDLKSPSARICVGRVVEIGTGAVELLQNL